MNTKKIKVLVCLLFFVMPMVSLSAEYDASQQLLAGAKTGNVAMVEKALAAGANLDTTEDEGANTALILAVSNGHRAVVELLLDRGAYVNERDLEGNTVLMRAAARGYVEIVELLLKRKADVSVENEEGETALIKALMLRVAENIPAEEDYLAITKLLVGAGANVNHTDDANETALFFAAMGYPTVVKFLISAGAHVNARDNAEGTALMLAKTPKIVELLVDAEADVNVQDYAGYTPLMYAAEGNRPAVVEALLGKGAFSGMRNKNGETAREIAKQQGYKNVIAVFDEFRKRKGVSRIWWCSRRDC